MVSQFQKAHAEFVDAGVTDLYMVLELEIFMYGPYFLIDSRELAKTEKILFLLRNMTEQYSLTADWKYETFHGFLFVGDHQILKNLKSGYIVPRPHLASALASAEADPVQLVYCPSGDQLRAIREMVPPLPSPVEQLDGRKLSEGIQSATVGVQIEPMPRIRLEIHSRNDEAAESLLLIQHQSLGVVAKLARKKIPVPGFDKIVETLKLNRTENRLSLEFEADQQNIEPFVRLLKPIVNRQQTARWQSMIVNDLKQLGLAIHNWHNKHNVFPAHANYSQEGQPLLSWRVHLLPYLDQTPLYQKFHLDEPWDSEHNKQLIAQIPEIFTVPGSTVAGKGKTGYVFPILPDGSAITTGTKNGITFSEITDGSSNTVMITQSSGPSRTICRSIWTSRSPVCVGMSFRTRKCSISYGQMVRPKLYPIRFLPPPGSNC